MGVKWEKYANPSVGVETELGVDWTKSQLSPCTNNSPECSVEVFLPDMNGESGKIVFTRSLLTSSSDFEKMKEELKKTTNNITEATLGGLKGFKVHKVLSVMDLTRDFYNLQGKKLYWEVEFRGPTKIWPDLQPLFEHVREKLQFRE